mgnify:CR=1 FL=1
MKDTKVLVEVAIMVALAFVFEVIFTAFPGMPFGGRVSLSMLPIIVLSWRRGIVPGMVAGVIFSILNMLLDGIGPAAWGITWGVFIAAVFLDYLIAFGLVGIAGIVKKPFGDNVYSFALGIVIASTLRFLFHFISGVVFWAAWAEEVQAGMNPALYSLIYNGTYMLPTLGLLLIVGIALYFPLKSYSDSEQLT